MWRSRAPLAALAALLVHVPAEPRERREAKQAQRAQKAQKAQKLRCESIFSRSDLRARAARLLDCDKHRDIHQHYSLTVSVGAGGFGTVLRAINKTSGMRRAVKKVDLHNTLALRALAHEVAMLRRLDQHHGVVNLVDVFVDSASAYLVMELCYGVDLFDWIEASIGKATKESEIQRLVLEMVEALKHCHDSGVLHLDVKPENFVFESGEHNLKLIDFGLAEPIDNLSRKISGTEGYFAPETLRGEKSPASDAWALAVTVFIMLTGGFMPRFVDSKLDYASVQALNKCSHTARSFLNSLLIEDPKQRMSLAKALEHPFLKPVVAERKAPSSKQPHLLLLQRRVEVLIAALRGILNSGDHVPLQVFPQGARPKLPPCLVISGGLEVKNSKGQRIQLLEPGDVLDTEELPLGTMAEAVVETKLGELYQPINSMPSGDADEQHLRMRVELLCALLPLVMASPHELRIFEAGDLVVARDGPQEAFLLLSGAADVVDGAVKFHECRMGEVVGEQAVLFGTERKSNVVASSRVEALLLSPDLLEELKRHKGEFMWFRELCDRREFRIKVLQLLRKSSLFQTSQLSFLHDLTQRLRLEHVQAGASLVKQGELGSDMFILHEGDMDVVLSLDGQEQVLEKLQPGAVVGEIEMLFPGRGRRASLLARSSCSVLVLGQHAFDEVTRGHPEERARLQDLANRHQENLERMAKPSAE